MAAFHLATLDVHSFNVICCWRKHIVSVAYSNMSNHILLVIEGNSPLKMFSMNNRMYVLNVFKHTIVFLDQKTCFHMLDKTMEIVFWLQ